MFQHCKGATFVQRVFQPFPARAAGCFRASHPALHFTALAAACSSSGVRDGLAAACSTAVTRGAPGPPTFCIWGPPTFFPPCPPSLQITVIYKESCQHLSCAVERERGTMSTGVRFEARGADAENLNPATGTYSQTAKLSTSYTAPAKENRKSGGSAPFSRHPLTDVTMFYTQQVGAAAVAMWRKERPLSRMLTVPLGPCVHPCSWVATWACKRRKPCSTCRWVLRTLGCTLGGHHA